MNALKGRLGYYATTYDIYLKLKSLKKWYWEAVKKEAAKRRWNRKRPENRIGKEPIVCPHLYKTVTIQSNWKYGSSTSVTGLNYDFIHLFNKIRMPAKSPEEIPLITTDQLQEVIDVYEQVKTWLEN